MKVLIAVADKHLGTAIVDFVKAHPWPSAVEFKILNVLEPFPLGSTDPSYATEKLMQEDRRLAQKIVDFVGDRLKEKFPTAKIEFSIMTGVPNRAILETAENWQADLIVMGSHCCTTADRIILGSTPLSVAPHAHCSVAIVRLKQAKALQFELTESDLPDQVREFIPSE